MGLYHSHFYSSYFLPLAPAVVLTPETIYEIEFHKIELLALNFQYQFFTCSTFIVCLVLILFLVVANCYEDYYDNYYYGALDLDCYYIVVYKEWWRLVTPLFLVGGCLHLICIALIQVNFYFE